MGKKPTVSVTYENERISIKNSLPYLKCVLRLSCVVHGPNYGRFYIGFFPYKCSYFELGLPVVLMVQNAPETILRIRKIQVLS